MNTGRFEDMGHGFNLSHLISHRAHSLRPMGASAQGLRPGFRLVEPRAYSSESVST